jgi:hypothetical protein
MDRVLLAMVMMIPAVMVFQDWGFGDGDGFTVALYPPGIQPPSTMEIENHASGGRQ